jgi:hypothetical protein
MDLDKMISEAKQIAEINRKMMIDGIAKLRKRGAADRTSRIAPRTLGTRLFRIARHCRTALHNSPGGSRGRDCEGWIPQAMRQCSLCPLHGVPRAGHRRKTPVLVLG